MMHSAQGMLNAGYPATYQQSYFDDLAIPSTTQYAPRRPSRSSHGHQQMRPGFAMRVSKPNSTSNSPKAMMQARRRTMMLDTQSLRRQQQVIDYLSTNQYSTNVSPVPATRPARPLSWHPATMQQAYPVLQQQPQQQAAYPLLTPNMFDYQDMYMMGPHFSPMVESYSNETSPSSTFSPLPLFPNDNMNYVPSTGMDIPQKPQAAYTMPEQSFGEAFPLMSNDWNGFIMTGFDSTTPPTPETVPQAQQPQPHLATVPDVVAPAAEQPEDDGEILVGMGLYDTPEKDAHISTFNTGMSLFGSPTEPQGKGLKLAETWEPPASADEDEDEDDSDDE